MRLSGIIILQIILLLLTSCASNREVPVATDYKATVKTVHDTVWRNSYITMRCDSIVVVRDTVGEKITYVRPVYNRADTKVTHINHVDSAKYNYFQYGYHKDEKAEKGSSLSSYKFLVGLIFSLIIVMLWYFVRKYKS